MDQRDHDQQVVDWPYLEQCSEAISSALDCDSKGTLSVSVANMISSAFNGALAGTGRRRGLSLRPPSGAHH